MKKGDLIYWEISDLKTTEKEISDLGFGDYLSDNGFKKAMLKAVNVVQKRSDRMYRRFNDKGKSVSFGIFLEQITDQDITIDKELVVTLDKKTGSVEFSDHSHPMSAEIMTLYRAEQLTIDSTQFRSMVKKVVRNQCHGISMRTHGGIYFIDDKFKESLGVLRGLFNAFPQAQLKVIPIYDDAGSLDAIEDATHADIFGDIEALIKEVKDQTEKGAITERVLEGKVAKSNEILKKIKIHEANLREKANEVKVKLSSVVKQLQDNVNKAEQIAMNPEDFLSALASL